mgnify:CR=1 FL=1
MFRLIYLIAILIITIPAQAGPASAGMVEDCFKASGDKSIRACTRLINSGRLRGRNLAVTYTQRGYGYRNKRQFDLAIVDYKKAIKLNPTKHHVLNNLAIVYQKQGRYDEAISLHKRALAIREKKLGRDHPDVAASLNNLATIYQEQSRYGEAIPLQKRAMAILEKKLGRGHPDVALSLHNLAIIYQEQGRYGEAIPLQKRAMAIREKKLGRGHPDVANNLNSLAAVYDAQGRYDAAIPLYKRSLAIRESKLGRDHPHVATSLNNLANVYQAQGRYDEAIPLHKRALAIRKKKLGRDHPRMADSLNNLALIYQGQGRYDEAIPLHKRALAIREKKLGRDHPHVADSLNNLANVYEGQGRYDEAIPLHKRALAIRERKLGRDHPDVAASLNNLAIVYRAQGRYDAAYDLVRRSVSIHSNRADRSLKAGEKGQTQELSHVRYVFRNMVGMAWNLSSQEPSRLGELGPETFEAAQLAGRTSAGAALSQMAARLGSGNSAVSVFVRERQDLINHWQKLDKDLIKVVSAPEGKGGAGKADLIRAGLKDTDQKIAQIDARLEREFPEFAELSNPKPLSMGQVIKLLGPDEALLAYLVTPQYTFLWAITREGIRWARSELSKKDIEAAVKKLRTGLEMEEVDEEKLFDLKAAHKLYKELVGPVADLIKDKKHLLIVPSGALTSLPFHLLVTEPPAEATPDFAGYRNAAWLLKTHATTTLPSVSSLRALRVFAAKGNAAKPYRGYGDPIFNRNGTEGKGERVARAYSSYYRGSVANIRVLSETLPRLSETEQELKAVARSLGAPTSEIRLRDKATETAVKRDTLKDYRVVHFATHALVAGETQEAGGQAEPALALTLPNKASTQDDGLLMASEVAQLKLNADWVVLSACNTAAAGKPGAEALSGLARAFFYAGSRALLVSHWNVQSDAAVKLTSKTFEILRQDPTIGRSEALRRSMLAMMNDRSNPANAYTAIWAPFVVIGEGGIQSGRKAAELKPLRFTVPSHASSPHKTKLIAINPTLKGSMPLPRKNPLRPPLAAKKMPNVSYATTFASRLSNRSDKTLEGRYVVQIASHRREVDALAEFDRLQSQHPNVVGDYQVLIKRADLGERGVYFRLRIGLVATKEEAVRLCAAIKAVGKPDCLIRRK